MQRVFAGGEFGEDALLRADGGKPCQSLLRLLGAQHLLVPLLLFVLPVSCRLSQILPVLLAGAPQAPGKVCERPGPGHASLGHATHVGPRRTAQPLALSAGQAAGPVPLAFLLSGQEAQRVSLTVLIGQKAQCLAFPVLIGQEVQCPTLSFGQEAPEWDERQSAQESVR